MISRAVVFGGGSLLVALSCSSPEQSGDGQAGAGTDGGKSAGGQQTSGAPSAGKPPVGGKSGSEGGSGAGSGAETAGAGDDGGTPPTVAGAGGEPTSTGGAAPMGGSAEGGGAATSGAGGTDDGGAPSCIADVGTMPAGPLAPTAPECASGCSVPPFDGVTLPTGCGDASNEPPAAAIGAADGVPPGTWVDVNGQPTQPNGPAMTGAPCDVGWCPGFKPKDFAIGMSTSSGPYPEAAEFKVGVGEVVHLARTQKLIEFDYAAINPLGFDTIGPVDVEHYSDYFVAPGQSGGWVPWGDPFGAVLGVDTRPGTNLAYVAYAGVWSRELPPVKVLGARFGTVTGENPTFEDLPAGWDPLADIQVDEHGDAIVLQKGVVYRHLASGWQEVAMPCDLTPSQLVIDGANAVWYVLGKDSTLYRRAADGSWTKTPTPGGRLIVAGGTVHLVGQGIVHRVGTAWSQPLVSPNEGASPDTSVAIDTCWAPHLVTSRIYDYSYYASEMDYTRWTSRGFLTLRRFSHDFPYTALAVTHGHVFVHGGGNIFVLPIR